MESHTLVTEDGYQLTLHRIPYSAKFRRRHSPLDNNPLNSNEAGTESEPRGGRTDYAFETSGKPAVFLQHGVLASSLDWVLTGPHKALGKYRKGTSAYEVILQLGKTVKSASKYCKIQPDKQTFKLLIKATGNLF